MKKKIICALLIAVSAMSLIACGDKDNKDVSSNPEKEVTEEVAEKEDSDQVNKPSKESKNDSSKEDKGSSTTNLNKKAEYKQKLDDIEKGLSDLESYRAGTTAEMKYAAGEEYDRWDKALNEIYSVLKENLSKDEMSKLEAEETKWIKDKEEKAKEAGKEFEGGTAEGLAYTSSLAETTKNRCYELVNKYMK